MPKTAPKTPGRRNRRRSTGPDGHPIDRQRQRINVGARAPTDQQHYTIRGPRPQARPPLTPSPTASAGIVSSSTDDPESSPMRHRRRSPTASPASNYLLEALQRIRALQDELDFLENDPYAEDTDDEELNDGAEPEDGAGVQVIGGQQAEAIGWAVCAREAIQFLQREGIPPDSPLMLNLRRRLIGTARPPDGAGLDEGLSC